MVTAVLLAREVTVVKQSFPCIFLTCLCIGPTAQQYKRQHKEMYFTIIGIDGEKKTKCRKVHTEAATHKMEKSDIPGF